MVESDPKPTGRELAVGPDTFKFTTTPLDAETIYADGVKGVIVTEYVAKISFYEQVNNLDDGITGRHTVNVALPLDQFLAVVEYLAKVASDVTSKVANKERGKSPETKA